MLRSRQLQVFVAVLAIAALLALFVPLSPAVYWPIAVMLAVLLATGSRKKEREVDSGFVASGAFLCDRCKYNDARYCSRPERPNASSCDEFKPQGG